MIALVIALLIVMSLETIILAEVIYHALHPNFIFEIDDADPDDVKFALHAKNNDVPIPGRLYFMRGKRK